MYVSTLSFTQHVWMSGSSGQYRLMAIATAFRTADMLSLGCLLSAIGLNVSCIVVVVTLFFDATWQLK